MLCQTTITPMAKIFSAVFFISLCLAGYSQSHINFRQSPLDSLKKDAIGKKQLIYLFFTNPGCEPCRAMKNNVFTDSTVAGFYNRNFINSIINNTGKDTAAKNICIRYQIVRYPSHLFINGKGEVINRTSGYRNVAGFLKLGKETRDGITRDYYSKLMLAGDYSFETVSAALRLEEPALLFADSNYRCRSQEILDNYFSRQKEGDYSSKESWTLLKNYEYNPHSMIFQYLVNHQDNFVRQFGKQDVDIVIYNLLDNYGSGNSSSDRYKNAQKEIKAMDIPQARVRVQFDEIMDSAYRIRRDSLGNWNDLVKKANELILDNYHMINRFEINDWCWTIYKRFLDPRGDISRATMGMICQWMNKTSGFEKDYEFEDTYAHILFSLGKQKEAIEAESLSLDHAIQDKADNKTIDSHRRELELFREKKE